MEAHLDATAIKAMMSEIAPVIREYFDAQIAPVLTENKALATRVSELEARPVPAEPVAMDEIRAVAKDEVVAALAALPEFEPLPDLAALAKEAAAEQVATLAATLPLPEKGEPGPQGERGPAGEVDMDAVKALIEVAVAALPPAERGEKGDPGEVDMGAVAELIDKAMAALPVPKDGKSCDMDAVAEMVAARVKDAVSAIPQPKDGVGLANALKDEDGCLVLVMTDGTTKNLGRVNGKDGEHGITPEFMDAEFVGRTLRLTFGEGERQKSIEFQMATPEYRGVFKETETYEPGDMVTWAGSCWHCDEAKGLKPGAPDSGWTLAVKAGRTGKDSPK